MKYELRDAPAIEIKTIVLDLNGTLAVKGKIVDGVKERISKLHAAGIEVILLTGNQRGNADDICGELGIRYEQAGSQEEKENVFLKFDAETTAAIGNARIDIGMYKHAKISVGTMQAEGIHVWILQHIDILVPSINDALDLFLDPDSLVATMRV